MYAHNAAQARLYFLAAIRDAPSQHALSRAHCALGYVAERTEDLRTAEKEYQLACEADKSNQLARSSLQRVRQEKKETGQGGMDLVMAE